MTLHELLVLPAPLVALVLAASVVIAVLAVPVTLCVTGKCASRHSAHTCARALKHALTHLYSKEHDNRTPPPNLPYLPDPTPYERLLSLSLQLSRPSPVAPRVPGGLCPPGVPQRPLGEKVWIAVKTVKVAISM